MAEDKERRDENEFIECLEIASFVRVDQYGNAVLRPKASAAEGQVKKYTLITENV